MDQHNIPKINLLKINAEGGEMDVLKGVQRQNHWHCIKQMVIKVYDTNGRLQEIKGLLEHRGFSVEIEQEDLQVHKLMNIYILYAVHK